MSKLGKTPIQLAMARGHDDVVKVLQRWGEICGPTKLLRVCWEEDGKREGRGREEEGKSWRTTSDEVGRNCVGTQANV